MFFFIIFLRKPQFLKIAYCQGLWHHGRAFAHNQKGRRFESQPDHFQVTALSMLLTCMYICHQAVFNLVVAYGLGS